MKETELINLRGKREKHFLQENGDIVAKMYSDDIHFYNNGVFEEIDNTLVKEDNYYYNKNNSYKVYFKEKCDETFMKYNFENHFLNLEIMDCKNQPITVSKFDNKFTQQVMYSNVFDNIDFIYDIFPTCIKENIIINNPDSLKEKICFKVFSDLNLSLDENNCINIGDKLCFEKPYIIDATGRINKNIYYNLNKENNYYILEFKLDTEALLKDNLIFPITIDPTITNYGENNSVYDTYIYPGDTNDVRYDREYIKVGVENDGKINRGLIKFELPKIGTGSQIINAELRLRGYPDFTHSYASDIVTIHRITESWTENGANWNNMNDKFDSRVEAAFESSRMYYMDGDTIILALNGDNLTNLVKKWYSMYPNYGLMLKTAKEVYNQSVIPMFFSKNNTVSGGNPKPLLVITYRNQNGLEEYMDYKTIPFINGNAYINSYNGNLTTNFEIGRTIKGKFPIELDLIYNTNDVVLENNFGLGKGYKFNLQQTIKPVTIEQRNYLEYLDEDGTLHYFLNDNGTYIDEDGLNLTITQENNSYLLKDKNNNIKIFQITNNVGYLITLQDCDGNTVSIDYNNDLTIARVTDANNNQINITYASDIITINSPNEITYLNYTNNKISSIVRNAGTTFINYNSNNLISNIIDEDGLKIGFEYYEQEPYRVKKVVQYATDDTIGNYYEIQYNYNSTTMKNNHNNVFTMTFNDNGSTESSSNLSSGEDVYNAYGRIEEYSDPIESESDLSYLKYKNKLLSIDLPCKYVKNYVSDSSFENNNVIFTPTSNVVLSIVSEQSDTGTKSLKATSSATNQVLTKEINVPKGNNYTFSVSIKNNVKMKISLSYTDSTYNVVEEFEQVDVSSSFERSDVSILYPSDAIGNLMLKIYLDEIGIAYIDDVQLEDGEVASPYNLLDNSDFSNGLTGWNLYAFDRNGLDVPTSDVFEVITLSNGKNALKVKMSPLYNSSFNKHFSISGKAGDTCRISFWYKNQGLKGAEDAYTRTNNRVIIRFNYAEQQHGHCILPSKQFNPNENEWQFFSASFTAEYDFNSMDLNFYQEFNANDFYVTNLYVVKDYRMVNYDYDENGNIISIDSLDNNKTEFEYNGDNELIKILSPNGNYFKYEYKKDFPSKINSAISDEEILTKINYDTYGNPVTTKIIPSKNQFEGGLAKIRIKGTNKYVKLSRSDIVVTERDCYHDYWYIDTTENDYSVIYNPVIQNYYLGINDTNDTIYTNETYLDICYNDDESCYIRKHGTNKYLKYDASLNFLTVALLDDGDDSFKFYIEITNNEKFIENNATYSSDGRFITSLTDSMVNTTQYEYDNATNLLSSVTNPNGVSTDYTYNNKKQLISVEKDNSIANYQYNLNNLLSKIIFNNKEYSMEYDKYLNRKNFKINNITLVSNTFDTNNGQLIKSTYGNNDEITYVYDDFNRIEKIVKSDDTFIFKYGNNGHLSKIISNDDICKIYYDLANRIRKYQFNDFKFKYDYDTNNRIVNTKYILNDMQFDVSTVYNSNTVSSVSYDNDVFEYYYDKLNRLIETKTTTYTYKNKGKRTSLLIESETNLLGTFKYKYDKLNNITHVYLNDNLIYQYYYDNLNQLIKEDDYNMNQTIVYTYNASGNMTNKKIYTINTTNLIEEKNYSYNNPLWEDQLTNFDNKTITYDTIGNPTCIGNDSLTWTNGRQLKQYNNIIFKYNNDGIRISKTNNNIDTLYYVEGNKIVLEKRGNDVIYYMYNDVDDIVGLRYNGNTYYYVKNFQNDIIAIIDGNNNIVAKYNYDSWGNILSIVDSNNSIITNINHIGIVNPFRYRGYYYDTETNLYYLNNRYYSPYLGRFINIDGVLGSNQDTLSYNLYLYASNNPLNLLDHTGNKAFSFIAEKIVGFLDNTIKALKKTFLQLPLPDYTTEINEILVKNTTEAKIISESLTAPNSLSYFYEKEKKHGPWDYKEKGNWNRDFSVPYTEVFKWNGKVMTPEDFGNIHYGFVGTAMGYSPELLFMGGGYAKCDWDIRILTDKYNCDDRNDHIAIKYGIDLYNGVEKY